jgi:hypothetical protein
MLFLHCGYAVIYTDLMSHRCRVRHHLRYHLHCYLRCICTVIYTVIYAVIYTAVYAVSVLGLRCIFDMIYAVIYTAVYAVYHSANIPSTCHYSRLESVNSARCQQASQKLKIVDSFS